MNIIVCVKQVPDPEAPPAGFRIDPEAKKSVPAQGVAPVISPFDEQAVEAALRLKDKGGAKVTILCKGTDLVADVVKKPLAMGADELVLLQDPALEGGDAYSTAVALAAAIKKIGQFDLVLCGRQAADWDAGQVGSGLAELLGLPCITLARKVEAADGKVKVESVVTDGYEVVEAPMPAVVTVSNELGEPRYPTLRGIMGAARKQPTVWKGSDIGLDGSKAGKAVARAEVIKLFIPTKESKCEMVSADTPQEAAAKLATRLRDAKLL